MLINILLLFSISYHSSSAIDPSTIPAPAYKFAFKPFIIAQRSATANSKQL